jgi:hypothetical protein
MGDHQGSQRTLKDADLKLAIAMMATYCSPPHLTWQWGEHEANSNHVVDERAGFAERWAAGADEKHVERTRPMERKGHSELLSQKFSRPWQKELSALADNPQATQKKPTFRDWLSRPYRDYSAQQKRKRDLWESLNRYITERGDSWIVSPPGTHVRIETRQGSDLAECLSKYKPTFAGTGERMIWNATSETFKDAAGHPLTQNHPGMIATDILELELLPEKWPHDLRPSLIARNQFSPEILHAPVTLPVVRFPEPDAETIADHARLICERKTLRIGLDCWQAIGHAGSYGAWVKIGAALAIGKAHALKVTGANSAWGRNYSREFCEWIKQHGFDKMPKSVRSVAIELHENHSAIEVWRSTLSEKDRRRLVHPLSNVRRWRAATAPKARPDALVKAEAA